MTITRIEYNSKSDHLGRCHFMLFWMANYHPGHPDGEYREAERGQAFFADPITHGHPRPEDAKPSPAKLGETWTLRPVDQYGRLVAEE